MLTVVAGNFLAKSTIPSFVWGSSVRVVVKRFNTSAQDVFDFEETDPLFPIEIILSLFRRRFTDAMVVLDRPTNDLVLMENWSENLVAEMK
jgi:hypothetical protein